MRYFRLIGATVALLVGCRRGAPEEQMTPDDWDVMSMSLSPCLEASAVPRTQEGKTWALRDPAGIIQWPVDLVELRVSSGTQRVWIGMDSSRVEYTVASMPPGGMASAIPMVMENRCMLPVGGHRALTHRLRSDSTVTKRTLYLADATVVVRDDVAIHVWIEAPSARRRDLLLHAVSELTLR